MSQKIFITGLPGSGKSSLVKEIIEELKDKKIAGIITPEIRKGKERYGFKIIDLVSGEEDILASVDVKSKFRISRYGVNIEGIDRVIDKFLESFDDADCIVLDELGVMELKSDKFRETLSKILNSDKNLLIILHRRFVEKYKKYEDLFFLTRENRDQIKEDIMKLLK